MNKNKQYSSNGYIIIETMFLLHEPQFTYNDYKVNIFLQMKKPN